MPRTPKNPRTTGDGNANPPYRKSFKLKLKNPHFKRNPAPVYEEKGFGRKLSAEIANRILFYCLMSTSDHREIKIDGVGEATGTGVQYKDHFKVLRINRVWRETFTAAIQHYMPEPLLEVSADIGIRPPNISRAGQALFAVPKIIQERADSTIIMVLSGTYDMSIHSVTEFAWSFVRKGKLNESAILKIALKDNQKTHLGEVLSDDEALKVIAFVHRCVKLAAFLSATKTGFDRDQLEDAIFGLAFYRERNVLNEDHRWVVEEWFMPHAGGDREISFETYRRNEHARLRRGL